MQQEEKKENELVAFFLRHPKYFFEVLNTWYIPDEKIRNQYHDIFPYLKTNKTKQQIEIENLKTASQKVIINYIQKNEKDLDFKILTKQLGASLSLEIIEKWKDKWDWYEISKADFIAWDIPFIKKYTFHLNWLLLSENVHLPWSIQLIDAFPNYWSWRLLLQNPKITCIDELLQRPDHKFSWVLLCACETITWSKEFVEQNKHRWEWRGWLELSKNKSFPWTEEFIDKYHKFWDWNELSLNPSLPWSMDFIKKHRALLNFDYLSENENLPWSLAFLKKYEHKLDWSEISENMGWVFSEEILALCKKNLYTSTYLMIENKKNIPWTKELIMKYNFWSANELGGIEADNLWDIELFEYVFNQIKADCFWSDPRELYNNHTIWKTFIQPVISDNVIIQVLHKLSLQKSAIDIYESEFLASTIGSVTGFHNIIDLNKLKLVYMYELIDAWPWVCKRFHNLASYQSDKLIEIMEKSGFTNEEILISRRDVMLIEKNGI